MAIIVGMNGRRSSPSPGPTPTPGDGIRVIKSAADWYDISNEGVEVDTLSELATLTGIAESDLETLFNSTIPPFLAITHMGVEGEYSLNPPAFYYAPNGKLEDVTWICIDEDNQEIEIQINDGKYRVLGLGE